MLVLTLHLAWCAAQISLVGTTATSKLDNLTAPFIFNSLSGLITQWSNTVHGTGHSIVPGILHPFTLLYHAREDDLLLPPSPEWLAWDPEMSYAIMVPRGGQTHLFTYRTTRPANVIYFDGMSAAWGAGWLDSQHMFIYGMSKNGTKDMNWWDDYGRAEKLCEWAKSRDVEGFVRMNAGFEIVWCDFQSPTLQLVSHLNITPPGTPERDSAPRSSHRKLVDFEEVELLPFDASFQDSFDDPEGRPPRRGPGDGDGPRRGPGRGGPGWRPRISDLALTGTLEWVRAASHRSFTPQPHLTLSYADMVTYYHPRLTSLVADRIGGPMSSHRLSNISAQDALSIVEEVDEALARSAAGDRGSGFDWGSAARGIVEYWGDRVSHMHAYLVNASNPDSNATASLPAIRTLAYTLLNPYMQPGLMPNASGWDLFFGLPSTVVPSSFAFSANITALERCMYQATSFLSQLRTTPQESLLQNSIESVLSRLCNEFGVIFAQSFNLTEADSDTVHRSFIQQWTRSVEHLMQWLDWTVWLRCENVCPLDYVCSTPVWPVAWFSRWDDDAESLRPRCMRMAV
ncbi:hypothetical protein B0H16DRAFT_1685644 [Mycena metata]|uniref:Uncharacterized protein n=1 Tax=Mycena metata TaxID=1033252 RepID=A0AAD7JVY6_9AGAR|nr:hypothetical protein B0H16DRAFT_1685644 [Mycena metata]